MNLRTIAMAVGLSLLVSGCKSGESTSNETQSASPNANPPASASNPPVTSQPPDQAAQGQSIRITPPDPNDPKFKQDPKLGGGG